MEIGSARSRYAAAVALLALLALADVAAASRFSKETSVFTAYEGWVKATKMCGYDGPKPPKPNIPKVKFKQYSAGFADKIDAKAAKLCGGSTRPTPEPSQPFVVQQGGDDPYADAGPSIPVTELQNTYVVGGNTGQYTGFTDRPIMQLAAFGAGAIVGGLFMHIYLVQNGWSFKRV